MRYFLLKSKLIQKLPLQNRINETDALYQNLKTIEPILSTSIYYTDFKSILDHVSNGNSSEKIDDKKVLIRKNKKKLGKEKRRKKLKIRFKNKLAKFAEQLELDTKNIIESSLPSTDNLEGQKCEICFEKLFDEQDCCFIGQLQFTNVKILLLDYK